MKSLAILGALLLTSCMTARVGDLGIIGDPARPLGVTVIGRDVTGRACQLGTPPAIEEAIRDAREKAGGGDAMVNASVDFTETNFLLGRQFCYQVRGDVVELVQEAPQAARGGSSPIGPSGDQEGSIMAQRRSLCADRHPGDLDRQEECLRAIEVAERELSELLRSDLSILDQIGPCSTGEVDMVETLSCVRKLVAQPERRGGEAEPTPPTPRLPPGDPTVAFCSERWPDDFVMRRSCVADQLQAVTELAPIMKSLPRDDPATRAVVMCKERWDVDYVMLLSCVKEQIQAAREFGSAP